MQCQGQLPSDLLAGLCITHSVTSHPVTSAGTGLLPACLPIWSGQAGRAVGPGMRQDAHWERRQGGDSWTDGQGEADPAQTKHTCTLSMNVCGNVEAW